MLAHYGVVLIDQSAPSDLCRVCKRVLQVALVLPYEDRAMLSLV